MDGSRKGKVSLLEFGPGKGTMMMNIVRIFAQLGMLRDIDIHFVEASPFLKKEQQNLMVETLKKNGIYMIYDESEDLVDEGDED